MEWIKEKKLTRPAQKTDLINQIWEFIIINLIFGKPLVAQYEFLNNYNGNTIINK